MILSVRNHSKLHRRSGHTALYKKLEYKDHNAAYDRYGKQSQSEPCRQYPTDKRRSPRERRVGRFNDRGKSHDREGDIGNIVQKRSYKSVIYLFTYERDRKDTYKGYGHDHDRHVYIFAHALSPCPSSSGLTGASRAAAADMTSVSMIVLVPDDIPFTKGILTKHMSEHR